MSGYAIRRLLRSLGWLLGNPSFGTIYPALHGLLQEGLVTVEVVPSPTRPARKVYTITAAGRRSVQEWVAQNPPASIGLRSFLMRLVLAGNSSPDGLIAHLRQRREAVVSHRAALAQAVEALDEDTGLGEIAAIEYGLAIATAELAWLEAKLGQLSTEAGTASQED
jgi:DNA-binding PadR family transcriptional regulator